MNIFSNIFNQTKETKKIISFDGGGVRAIAGVVFLKKLEAASGRKISDIFDMFVGTSAGAFNAACLAHEQMSADKLKQYWSKEYTDKIMETSFFWDQASLIQARPRYEAKGRVKVLKEIFSNKTLGDSAKPLLTLCYDIEKRSHVIHSTLNTPNVTFVDAVSASSAAPMYFPTYQMEDDSLRNDIMGMMLDSEIHNEIASHIIDKNYLRINSPIGKINKMLDDDSEENIEKIHLMGLEWWSRFGDQALKFIED